MDLATILLALITNAVLLAVLGFIARSIISQALSRDIERYKTRLQATHDVELERLRNDLRLKEIEYETKFSKLHEKRANVISELYKKLVEAERSLSTYAWPGPHLGGFSNKENFNRAWKDSSEFSNYFNENRIYLNRTLCSKLDRLDTGLSGVIGSVVGAEHSDQEIHDAWLDGWNKISKEIPLLKSDIENDFRILLGEPDAAKATRALP